jgi:hypothetical protein
MSNALPIPRMEAYGFHETHVPSFRAKGESLIRVPVETHSAMNEHDAKRRTSEVTLTCTHITYFFPVPCNGDVVYCHRCQDYSTVVFAESPTNSKPEKKVKDYRRAVCRECMFRRVRKTQFPRVFEMADTHHLKTGHDVDIYGPHGKVKTISSTVTES